MCIAFSQIRKTQNLPKKKNRTDDVTYVQVICTVESCSMACYLKVLRCENYIDTENISVEWVSLCLFACQNLVNHKWRNILLLFKTKTVKHFTAFEQWQRHSHQPHDLHLLATTTIIGWRSCETTTSRIVTSHSSSESKLTGFVISKTNKITCNKTKN